ncbi:hypothetical protein BDK51DRAFT_31548 [Blyttiomyces helicus]|uniref:DUF1746 domain-containing protein n=1 Tax=Blyttiomyces helicus TaxID=388810 RepID=A0A4P9W451_9FUNG|nr:hypothetical protein BDK51DRAFT_31548 [Blyttiomyces helicus]|eukprot:RKO85440.1 hypothetical protein BDK51DRAFT_31548 [Blyttiomyces helicus]
MVDKHILLSTLRSLETAVHVLAVHSFLLDSSLLGLILRTMSQVPQSSAQGSRSLRFLCFYILLTNAFFAYTHLSVPEPPSIVIDFFGQILVLTDVLITVLQFLRALAIHAGKPVASRGTPLPNPEQQDHEEEGVAEEADPGGEGRAPRGDTAEENPGSTSSPAHASSETDRTVPFRVGSTSTSVDSDENGDAEAPRRLRQRRGGPSSDAWDDEPRPSSHRRSRGSRSSSSSGVFESVPTFDLAVLDAFKIIWRGDPGVRVQPPRAPPPPEPNSQGLPV